MNGGVKAKGGQGGKQGGEGEQSGLCDGGDEGRGLEEGL